MVLFENRSPSEKIRILLVEEQHTEELFLNNLLGQIEGLDYELTWCRTTAKALRALSYDASFDIVITEYWLSEQGDDDFISEAKTLSPSAQIIVISSEMDSTIGSSLIKAGVTDYLVKNGLDALALERALRYALNIRDAHLKLSFRDHYDKLTGLVNRTLFYDRLLHAMQRAERSRQKVVLLTINLDKFKYINDCYGREAGDTAICVAAERLQSCVRKSDTLARNNGDEFAVILEGVSNESDVLRMVEQISEQLAKPYTIPGDQLHLGCSIGVAFYPSAGVNPEALLRAANLAMGHAKRTPGCSHCFYTEELSTKATNQLILEAEFRRALRRNEFRLMFQPRVDIVSGEIVGMEGLIRWQHPSRGLLSPDEFIPLAEETGLVVTMGYWVIHQACLALKYLQEQGHFVRIAVNLSFRQFQDKKLRETVARIIKKTQVDASYLEFELTETAVMANEQETRRCMDEISKLGVHFSLDDFGTGYSSFAHIQGLPITSLKIDKSFVENSAACDEDAVIVKAIINLAHNLNMKVIAEGVENFAQLVLLRDHKCDQVQGYFYHKAMSFENVCQRLVQQDSQKESVLA
ncbi:GGDEF domain/EAL domain protein [gamma proteobacterium IMCC2047]|nr:GGDEF domain/EAL domain protein [gamma proteobacterium IMCC2047]